MSITNCKLHFTQQGDKSIYMSGALLKQLNLNGKKAVSFRLGKDKIHATIRAIKRTGNHLYVPASIRNSIRVPKSGNIMVVGSADEVQIGPLIGVLTDGSGRSNGLPFGGRTGFIKELLRVGKDKAYFFAFTPRDIDWQKDTVTGYFLNDNGGFDRKTVPLPDVVYNRLPSRTSEGTGSMENFKERFLKRKIPFFNWSFFSKWEVYNMLKDDLDAYKHVPESFLNPTPERIKEQLEKHSFVYLKPTGGSLGRGIFRLTYHTKKGYFVRFRRNGANVLLRFTNFNSLMRMLQSGTRSRMRNYVLQQGIRLIEIDSCPIDFRFHLHKNGKNQWVVAGIGAKKAGKGSVTTHVKNGGQLMTPEQALGRVFGSRSGDVLEAAKKVSIKMAEAIENNYRHVIGELGLDIGIDKDENIWMFEANAKPGRSIFKHPVLRSEGKQSLVYIFEHCMYLSKFRTRKDG
ncbi:YheC/YheD family endospore coat-associated protein [Paenibacillus gansuensis]|uniref:YheC/YheD family protein n=1 Tax=Paenibacillus gansuensis TaxID=306542 RepID=A0ABW5PE05_9BACL